MKLRVVDLGAAVPYAEGMERMRAAMAAVDDEGPALLLQEHSPVITVTRQGGTAWVTTSRAAVEADGIELFETDRGGDVTFHGPGQLVGYPVLRLAPDPKLDNRVDLLGYLRALEDALVRACVRLGIADAHRRPGMTGVWTGPDTPEAPGEKLVAIGVGVSRGVTRHGFALNVSTDLESFTKHIVPCGLEGRGVTSLDRKLDVCPPMGEIKRVVIEEIEGALAPLHEITPMAAE